MKAHIVIESMEGLVPRIVYIVFHLDSIFEEATDVMAAVLKVVVGTVK